jgi:hypothetical protein
MTERWEPVARFDRYEVSDQGQVRSVKKKTRPREHPLILKLRTDPAGRPYVTLYPGKVTMKVCWLVAEAFLPPKEPGEEVCHKDGDPANNWATNLRYGTHLSNGQDMIEHGRTRRCEHGVSPCKVCRSANNRRSYQKHIEKRRKAARDRARAAHPDWQPRI